MVYIVYNKKHEKFWTLEKVKDYLKSLEYELLDTEYSRTDKKLTFKDKEGYTYFQCLNNLINTNTSYRFHKCNPYTIQNIKLWLLLNNKPFELVSNKYINASKSKLRWKCLKDDCGEFFEARWSHIEQGQGCSVCEGRQVSLSNCLATTHPDLVLEWHPTLNGKITPFNITSGSVKRIWWLCKICKYAWNTFLFNRTGNLGNGCPVCSESKGEKEIRKFLELNNIKFVPQKEFDDLLGIGNGKLSYDFYLPDYNLLIEYQGQFHDGNGNDFVKQGLAYRQEHDKRKRFYAKNNNIKLLEIWYWDFNNIEEILKKI